MSRALRIGIIAGLLGAGAVLGVGPADAKCIRGEIVVHWSGQPDQTVWPESHCFHDTGMEDDNVSVRDDPTITGMPTGTPSGVRYGVWLPIL